LNQKILRRSIVPPRFFISIPYTFFVWQALFGSYIRFFILFYGEIAILTARGRLRPEVTSPKDIAIMVSC
jgi:hypothetical protein